MAPLGSPSLNLIVCLSVSLSLCLSLSPCLCLCLSVSVSPSQSLCLSVFSHSVASATFPLLHNSSLYQVKVVGLPVGPAVAMPQPCQEVRWALPPPASLPASRVLQLRLPAHSSGLWPLGGLHSGPPACLDLRVCAALGGGMSVAPTDTRGYGHMCPGFPLRRPGRDLASTQQAPRGP